MRSGAPAGPREPTLRLSGRAVVLGLLLFGLTLTGLLWIYWTLHTAPFRPLQDALAREFPGSLPRVEGGQRKIHKGTPRILRATLRVDFDLTKDSKRGDQVLDQVQKLAARYVDLSSYDEISVFLYHGVPEQQIQEREFNRPLKPPAPP